MKKLILYISCIMTIVFLSGCAMMDNTPTKKVEKFLNSYKNQDETVINQLNDMVSSDSMMNENQRTTYTEIIKKQYSDLSYEIKDEVIDGDTATVTAEIEVYDYYKTNQEANQYYIENPQEFSNDTTNEDESLVEEKAEDVKEEVENIIDGNSKYIDYRLGKLSETSDKVTYTIDFTLTKIENVWTLNEIDDMTRQKIHGLYSH